MGHILFVHLNNSRVLVDTELLLCEIFMPVCTLQFSRFSFFLDLILPTWEPWDMKCPADLGFSCYVCLLAYFGQVELIVFLLLVEPNLDANCCYYDRTNWCQLYEL